MADAPASSAVVDFTNVKETGGTFNKKRQPEGDYRAKITKVVDAPAKSDGVMQWLFTITAGAGTYPYYIKHEENQYWKLRNLLIACNMNVPKKRVQVNPNKLVGKVIGVTLEDDEYKDKLQSTISATIPVSELEADDLPDEVAEDDEDEDPIPAVKTQKVKKPAPVEEEEDDEEDEEPAPPPAKKKKAAAPPPVEEDDDDLEEIDIDDT